MRIGIVGAGVIGQLRAKSVLNNPNTSLVAVMDSSIDAAKRASSGSGARACSDLESFFDVDADAVIVSSPPHVHEQACLEAFARGRHVLCEKPLANSVDAAKRIVAAAVKSHRALGVGFNLRYYPAIHFLKDTIDRGTIGRLDHLRIFGGHEGLSKFRVDWQYKAPESGGGAMWDVGVHMTDLARYFLGDVTDVYGVMSNRVWEVPGSEDNAMALMRNAAGITASYHATWTEWKGYQFFVEAYGDLGMVRGAYAPMQNLLVTRDRAGHRGSTSRLRYPGIMVREKLQTWHSTALLSFQEELIDFLALARGNSATRIADGYDGLRALEVADAVRRSTETGERVALPALGRMHL